MPQNSTTTAARLLGRHRAGSESMEWGLVSGLLVAVAIVALLMLSPKMTDLWNDTNNGIPASGGGAGGASGGGAGGGGGSGGGSLPGEQTSDPGGVGYGSGQGT
jgi:hypothetical protein